MRFALVLLLVLVALAPALYADEDRAYFQATTCSNAAAGAWIITNVGDSCGCLVKLYGVDCGLTRFAHYFRIEPRKEDPGSAFDYYYSGTNPDGRSWYVKIDLDRDGRFAAAWGVQADGTYYEAFIDATSSEE